MNDDVKYYKAFDPGLSCRGFLYKVGEEYRMDGAPVICKRGFHFCPSLSNVYQFYPASPLTRVCLVTPLGRMVSEELGDVPFIPSSCFKFLVDKFCTNRIRIDRELEPDEIIRTLVEDRDDLRGTGRYRSAEDVDNGIRNIRTLSDIMACDPSWSIPAAFRDPDPKWITERAVKFRQACADAFPS